MKKNYKLANSLIGFIVFLLLILFILYSTNIYVNQFDEIENAIQLNSKNIKKVDFPTDSLKIMSWNIKFAGGRIDFYIDCHGDRVKMTSEEVTGNLSKIVQKINTYNPDILFIQEIDFESDRSGSINMVQWILDHTQLNYGTYASQWDVGYLPEKFIGKVNTGNAIFSKWELTNAQRISLPLKIEQGPVDLFFYPRRNILTTEIAPPGKKKMYLLNTNIEKSSIDLTRSNQIKLLREKVERLLLGRDKIIVFGGSLNTIPPDSKKKNNFDDDICSDKTNTSADYSAENELLRPFYAKFREIIPLNENLKEETNYYTFTSNGNGYWNRRLDYLFTNRSWKDGLVHQNHARGGLETMKLSDHAPITGTLFLNIE